MHIKHFVAAGLVVLPALTMLGNGCTVHESLVGLDLDGAFANPDGTSKSDAKKSDSSSSDDGSTTGDTTTTTCAPGDVSSLAPNFHPPTAFHQAVCTSTQVTALIDCLSNLPDAATCKTFTGNAANKTCISCAVTLATAASYGPLVEGTVTIEVNTAGCVARSANDVTATGCGGKMAAKTQCEQLACEANCPVPATDDGTLFAKLLKCQSDSDGTVCKSYSDAALCADALEDGGPAAQCALNGTTFSQNANTMVTLFCGP